MKHKLTTAAAGLILLLLLSGCGNRDFTRPGRTEVYGYDFRKYNNEGFLFTPESYSAPYESLGFIVVRVFPAIYKDDRADTVFNKRVIVSKYNYQRTTTQDLIDSVYSVAKGFGADAVVNFRINWASEDVLEAEGFAIKRK